MEQVQKWNEDFMEPLIEAQKEDAKERERGRTQLKAVNYFRKKAPWYIFDRVLNMPRILNMLGLHRILNDKDNRKTLKGF